MKLSENYGFQIGEDNDHIDLVSHIFFNWDKLDSVLTEIGMSEEEKQKLIDAVNGHTTEEVNTLEKAIEIIVSGNLAELDELIKKLIETVDKNDKNINKATRDLLRSLFIEILLTRHKTETVEWAIRELDYLNLFGNALLNAYNPQDPDIINLLNENKTLIDVANNSELVNWITNTLEVMDLVNASPSFKKALEEGTQYLDSLTGTQGGHDYLIANYNNMAHIVDSKSWIDSFIRTSSFSANILNDDNWAKNFGKANDDKLMLLYDNSDWKIKLTEKLSVAYYNALNNISKISVANSFKNLEFVNKIFTDMSASTFQSDNEFHQLSRSANNTVYEVYLFGTTDYFTLNEVSRMWYNRLTISDYSKSLIRNGYAKMNSTNIRRFGNVSVYLGIIRSSYLSNYIGNTYFRRGTLDSNKFLYEILVNNSDFQSIYTMYFNYSKSEAIAGIKNTYNRNEITVSQRGVVTLSSPYSLIENNKLYVNSRDDGKGGFVDDNDRATEIHNLTTNRVGYSFPKDFVAINYRFTASDNPVGKTHYADENSGVSKVIKPTTSNRKVDITFAFLTGTLYFYEYAPRNATFPY